MSQSDPGSHPEPADAAAPPSRGWQDTVGRIGVDWWATIVAGAIAVLAAANLLPKIPW